MSRLSKKELKDLLNLMEELSWVVSKYKSVDFKSVQNNLVSLISEQNEYDKGLTNFKRYRDKDSNKNYLIGVLPKFFQDKELFGKNLDLAEFAECLGIFLNNPEKKSRYEIIGTMLCTISEMDERSLEQFVNAIDLLLGNDNLLNDIKSLKKNDQFSYNWNEVIKVLSGENK